MGDEETKAKLNISENLTEVAIHFDEHKSLENINKTDERDVLEADDTKEDSEKESMDDTKLLKEENKDKQNVSEDPIKVTIQFEDNDSSYEINKTDEIDEEDGSENKLQVDRIQSKEDDDAKPNITENSIVVESQSEEQYFLEEIHDTGNFDKLITENIGQRNSTILSNEDKSSLKSEEAKK